MPADDDYRSAAAALATSTITSRTPSPRPGSDQNSNPLSSSSSSSSPIIPTRSSQDAAPTWARPTPSSFRRLSTTATTRNRPYHNRAGSLFSQHSEGGDQSLKARVMHNISAMNLKAWRLFTSLTPVQRAAVVVALCVLFTLSILGLVYSHRIFAALGPIAKSWRALPAGWLIVWVMCFCTAFPPVIGYSTTVSIAGFVYGFPWGWPIVASATVAGSTVAFFTSRGIFSHYVHRLVGTDKRFVALGQVLRRDGLGVLAMIRFCPLPYSLSNGFLATVPSVKLWTFAGATALATPKLAIHVFIGSRLALLAESGDDMTAGDRAINYASMIVFGIVGFAVGLIIYRRTMARAAELAREDGLEAGDDVLADAAAATADGIIDRHDDDDDLDFDYADEEQESSRLMRPIVNHKSDADVDAAALMNDDDDISLWETDPYGNGMYRDSWDDEQPNRPNGATR
ncbi:hypothetical protein B0H66DRAFT_33181 [Apodospora peruviana]|uniref:Golgi apparatus membrane protein TVP38 n=1 Tax=Apodospora peruviana TaxID=516989 RepID=A0AAE0IQX1_9PEZI|nr:hypothetical protein B0H66DRAFT_33181 [Apodospora peruviana]